MALYAFRDVDEQVIDNDLPSEALNFNGFFFEVEIPGYYRTLYTKGRETMNVEISTAKSSRNGIQYQRKRYPERYITVGFLLRASTCEEFREAFNKLNEMLDTAQARLIFNDEPDKYYIGTPQGIGDVPAGTNEIQSEITFICPDPFKYSVKEYEIDSSDGAITAFYNGSFPAYPKLEAEVSADTQYIGFTMEGHSLTIGTDDAEEEVQTTEKLLDVSSDDSSALAGASVNSAATVCQDSSYGQSGSARRATGLYGSHTLICANTWGSGSNWHGPSLTWNLGENCTNFRIKANIWFHEYNSGEIGTMKILCSDTSGNNVCGSMLKKTSKTSQLGMRYEIINGQTLSNDVSMRTEVVAARNYKKSSPIIDVSTNATITIEKIGNTIKYYYPTKLSDGYQVTRTYTSDDYEALSIRFVTIYLAMKDPGTTYPCMWHMGLRRLRVWKLPDDATESDTEMLYSGDTAVIDIGSGAILHNGEASPKLGAITNDWEGFALQKGRNEIVISSDSSPSVKLKYREVFL